MIASYIGVEVSSEVSVPLAQKQSFQSPSMRSPTREAIGVVCLRSFGVDETVAWVLSTRGCVQRTSQKGEQFYLGCVGSLASVGVSATQLHIILDSCRTCELYRGPCLIRWGCRWLVRVRTMRWFGHAAHVPHARLPNDASCVHFKKYLNQVN